MTDFARKPLSDLFEEEHSDLPKVHRAQILALEKGDILLCHMPAGDFPPEVWEHVMKQIGTVLFSLGVREEDMRILMLPEGVSFSVLRTAAARDNTPHADPRAAQVIAALDPESA